MKEVILLKDGEIALKGLNRSTFEDILVKNIKNRLKEEVGIFTFTKAQSTITIEPENENEDLDEAVEVIKHVFGVAALSRAAASD